MQTRQAINLLTIFAFVCLTLTGHAPTAAQTKAQSPLPAPTGFVNDYAEVIDAQTQERMETILRNLNDRAQIEFAVVTIRTTGDQPIFDYSLAVARGWAIGPGDDASKGLLLLVAVDDRKYQTLVSRHLQGDLPDGLVGEIGRRMREPFRANDYSAGLMTAVETFVATLSEKQGFNIEGIDRRRAYRPQVGSGGRLREGTPQRGMSFAACCIIGIVLLFLLSMMSGRRGGGGGGGSGCLNALLLANLFSSLGQTRGSSDWGGGGFGGSSGWGGGGGDGGGFGGFGGGGDFDGGGAGGDW
ncbi:MAG TPA: TPM domain-containing protein [Pyrinomonadaceae bacterium]|nr:TPM domain-containing protein [Pyrinomonadaceae bacterium]